MKTPEELEQDFKDAVKYYSKEEAINFGTWYSGMEREKVIKAYDRYLREKESIRNR
jgi:hypothetical protein